eukprot:scaffold3611_cov364-Prasinococcus_capsulatus_cf.AAC.10
MSPAKTTVPSLPTVAGDHGVTKASGGVRNGHGTVAHGVHLIKPARLESGGHDQDVCSRRQPVREWHIEADPSPHVVPVGALCPLQPVLQVYVVLGAPVVLINPVEDAIQMIPSMTHDPIEAKPALGRGYLVRIARGHCSHTVCAGDACLEVVQRVALLLVRALALLRRVLVVQRSEPVVRQA